MMVVVPKGNALPLVGPAVCAMEAPLQLSVTVGAVQVAMAVQFAPASRLMLAGHPTTVGGVTSFTVTVKEQVLVLPLPSVAV